MTLDIARCAGGLTDDQLIAEALAAGRITHCRPGIALGITPIERVLWTATPGLTPQVIETQRLRALRSARQRQKSC